MNKLRAYEVFLPNVYCCTDYLGIDLGSIYERCDLWQIIYATTPSKAKYKFIQYYAYGNENYAVEADLEFTDPIRVRLLAKNVEDTGEHPESEGADWRKADLTDYGKKFLAGWEMAVEGL